MGRPDAGRDGHCHVERETGVIMDKNTPLPGNPLSGDAWRSGEVIFTHGDPNAQYDWDCGVAISAYLNGLKEGKILGMHCKTCDRTVVPTRSFCEICFEDDIEFVELQSTGTVNTFSVSHVRWDVTPADPPELPAVIEIDGADPLKGILHMLGEVEPDDIKIGMKVEAVWKPEGEREGSITDIKYWKPL